MVVAKVSSIDCCVFVMQFMICMALKQSINQSNSILVSLVYKTSQKWLIRHSRIKYMHIHVHVYVIPYSGKFSRAQIFANHQRTRQEKKFAIFIFTTRSRYLTTPPTFCMGMVTLSVYFNIKTTVRR